MVSVSQLSEDEAREMLTRADDRRDGQHHMKVQPLSVRSARSRSSSKEQEVPQHTEPPPVRDPRLEGKDAFVLSFSQRRLWFLDQLEPGSAFYNFPLAVPFNVAVNAAVLQRSINEIVRRHEALRTVFDQVDGEPVQIVLPEMTLPLDVVDLRMIDKESRDRRAHAVGRRVGAAAL